MEFYRSVLLYFIDLYFEAAERRHPTFLDACNFYAEAFSSNDLKTLVGVILLLLQEQDFAPADPDKKEICRRKLQDHIFNIAEELTSLYKNVGTSGEACSKLRKHLVRKDLHERDAHLLDFAGVFKDDKTCRSKCSIDVLLTNQKHEAAYKCVIANGASPTSTSTTQQLSKALKLRIESPDKTTCTRCSKIGDVIITLNCPTNFQIHTLDTSFYTLGPCFERIVRVHPSVASLLKDK